MRFPLASIFFIIASFVFFMCWSVGTFVIDEIGGGLDDTALPSEYQDTKSLLSTNTFGILSAIFFVIGILSIFLLDALADEPELYWRNR
jgi:hypothetical protein